MNVRDRSPMAGDRVADRYRLIDLVATGGMSQVWYAEDTRGGGEVAVKVLRPDLVGDPRFLRRLRMEARNTERLRHRNLVSLLDHGEVGGAGYLVQEFVEGESLASILERVGRLTPEQTVPILTAALAGLGAAHAAGVVHRDAKPANILIGSDGVVKMSDFGISFGADQPRLTSTGMVMGTAEYLSPEQATGKPATPASDLYAVGVIAHECLAGERPFRGRTQVDVALAQVEKEPPPLPASVPVPLRTAVLRLLAKDPARRPASAGDAAHLLQDALERAEARTPPGGRSAPSSGTGRSAPPPPPPPRPRSQHAGPIAKDAR